MSEQFGRELFLQVGPVALSGLRVAFSVEKSTKAEPNPATVKVYNLSEGTREKLSREKGARMALSAGYVGTAAIIYSGDVRLVSHAKQGPDWVTTITAGDGERAYRNAFASASFGAGTPVATVVRGLAEALGVGPGNVDQAMSQGNFRRGLTQYSSGYAVFGPAQQELSKVMAALGLEWSIQEGQLQVLRPAEVLPGTAVLLSSRQRNLIGSPEYASPDKVNGSPTLKARMLLYPAVRPGVLVQVESTQVNGLFKVLKCVHTGDTHGPEWTTEVEGKAV